MPQIADLEIAATWDEIELEAALRGNAGEAPTEPPTETLPSVADTIRAVEALRHLPKEERKRRAEELLRALTSARAAPSSEVEAEPDSSALASPSVLSSTEPVALAPEIAAVPPPEAPALADSTAASSELSPSTAEEGPSTEPVPEVVALTPESPVTAESVGAPPEVAASTAQEAPSSEMHSELSPGSPEIADLPPCALDAPALIVAEPTPDAAAASAPVAGPVIEAPASAPAAPPLVAPEPDAIPRFLTTECTTLEAEQPDSLIPFRAVAAAGALIGAVLLIYFWSSQEFGLVARPIFGAIETAPARAVAPKISASLAARQAFVALPPDFAAGPQPMRAYRPPLVGFDFMDDAAPPPAIAVKVQVAPVPSLAPPAALQPSDEETAALPSSPSSDVVALIKRGDDLLKAGDVAAARSAYERAAAGGNSKAQIGVGRTYDPLVLAKLGARGVRGDPVQAASWYARAGEAGDEDGQQRLHALISGLSDCMLGQGICANRKP
ncbi:MAG: hypothetical protein ACREFI_09375 [Stellaceae bacterium]